MGDDTYFGGNYWWIGVAMAVAGNFVDAFAYLLEKKSHIHIQSNLELEVNNNAINMDRLDKLPDASDEHELEDKEGVSYLCHCRWWLGFGTHIIGASLFSFSMGFGDQALLSPLQSITIAFNTILAWKFLNEKLNTLQIIGTILIIVGCGLVVAFGPKSTDNLHDVNELEALFRETDFLIFTGAIVFVFVTNYILFKCKYFTSKIYLLLSNVGFAAFYGSWNILFTKCFVEILTSSTQHKSVAKSNWTSWLTYVSLFLIIATMVTLEYWRQESLKNFPANYVGSIYTISIIVGGIAFGGMYFNEFQSMNFMNTIIFCVAVTIAFIGVGMLTFGEKYTEGRTASNYEEMTAEMSGSINRKMLTSAEISGFKSQSSHVVITADSLDTR